MINFDLNTVHNWTVETVQALSKEDFTAIFNSLECDNFHTENTIFCAKRTGNQAYIDEALTYPLNNISLSECNRRAFLFCDIWQVLEPFSGYNREELKAFYGINKAII